MAVTLTMVILYTNVLSGTCTVDLRFVRNSFCINPELISSNLMTQGGEINDILDIKTQHQSYLSSNTIVLIALVIEMIG